MTGIRKKKDYMWRELEKFWLKLPLTLPVVDTENHLQRKTKSKVVSDIKRPGHGKGLCQN